MNKTIRLTVPDWQAGNNPLYYLGAQVLNFLAPRNSNQKQFTIKIDEPTPANTDLKKINHVTAQDTVKKNLQKTIEVIDQEQPDKIITLGGNCLVSQAPFDYLHQKYGDDVGILWLDAHPDISTPEIFPNEHAMVLGNLIHQGDPTLQKLVKAPFNPESIMYLGLQEPTADEKKILPKLGINYSLQNKIDITQVQAWIDNHNFSKILVHFDIDALDPKLFHEQYFDQPGIEDYDVSHGKIAPQEVSNLLAQLGNKVVGLTIAEYLPWSALSLQEIMNSSEIFK
jgi:arginase